ncbi:hypothetical protein N7470_003651 [Penicillium chermesinum]|nr:hypothetical protein N7470_003651 [Penicillium chermesinum]
MDVRTTRSDRPFQRTYKACIPCRQRKAKCDLGVGPDGLPIGPPCARCRREMRECVFPEKRAWERSRKHTYSAEGKDEQSPLDTATPDHARSGGTKKQCVQSNHSPTQYSGPGSFQPDWAMNGPRASLPPSHSPQIISPSQNGERAMPRGSASPYAHSEHRNRSDSTLASTMMRTVVASGNDALNILFEAATAHSQEEEASRKSPLKHDNTSNQRQNQQALGYESSASTIPPSRVAAPVNLVEASQETLKLWANCRFVKMGWFTAREAVTFIDLFFLNMSCLSPILTDFYASHSNHFWLISREPVLCTAILMISSRYHILPGAGGESRNFFIHHRLWQQCQQMTMRLVFGQEKSMKSKVRSLGTVEALLLMAEWHPRSLHFPPETEGWDDDLISTGPNVSESAETADTSANRWLEDVIEPSRRSDQMSWMLLGCALSLAHELGIFETEEDENGEEVTELKEQMTLRRQRVQRLLYVYINQLAWRIGCMSPFRNP